MLVIRSSMLHAPSVSIGALARLRPGITMTQALDELSFTAEFLSMLAEAGTQSVKLPPRSPTLNCYAERFVRSIKESCLERMILFGEDALRTAVREFVAHYHGERNHQALAICSFSLTTVSLIVTDQFDAEAASEECSIIMIGPLDNVAAPVFGYYDPFLRVRPPDCYGGRKARRDG